MWWYWYIWNSHLSYAVNHWPNFAASHSLTALVQCNYHLVVLLYLKLPFEIPNYYCTRTDNHSPARHYRLKQLSTSTKNIKSFGWKYQTFRLKILNILAENIRRFRPKYFPDQTYNIAQFSWNEKHDLSTAWFFAIHLPFSVLALR